MTDLTQLESGIPLQLNYDNKSKTVLFIEKEDNKNYFFDGGMLFAFTDRFIAENVTIQFDNLNPLEVADLLELAKQ